MEHFILPQRLWRSQIDGRLRLVISAVVRRVLGGTVGCWHFFDRLHAARSFHVEEELLLPRRVAVTTQRVRT